ncbi:PfkB family carbohydrate kinase [Prochlorococcus sp. AH-716-A09]|nr:PfkB family carbohydrate kinase [Prochlorococcus sp. AH-716-A09]
MKISKENDIKLLGDVQCSSQIGYITKLRMFDLICANEKEARIALNDNFSGLETICKKLITETKVKNLIIKLGSKGFILYQSKNKDEIISQPFPALSSHPVDVAGAGDSLLATMACGISCGIPIVTTAALSCCVSCISVERMGNVPITANELQNELKNLDI